MRLLSAFITPAEIFFGSGRANRVEPVQIVFDLVQRHTEIQSYLNCLRPLDERPRVFQDKFCDFMGHATALRGGVFGCPMARTISLATLAYCLDSAQARHTPAAPARCLRLAEARLNGVELLR